MTPEAATGLLSFLSVLKDASAFTILGVMVWLLLDGRLVTRGHLNDVVAGKNAEIAKAEAREHAWKSLATRGATEIISPLTAVVVEQARSQLRGAGES